MIDTVRDHLEHGYSISCWCLRCKGFVRCSLHRLVMRGRGDKRLLSDGIGAVFER
jgi:hypothetical protein